MYQLLTVSGSDADTFLQGQLTQDVTRLGQEHILPAAWCNPKGRVVTTMRIIRTNDGIGLLLPTEIAASVLQRISIYKLRSDVQLEIATDWNCIAIQADAALHQLDGIGLLPKSDLHATCSNGPITAICVSTNPRVVEVFGPEASLNELDCQQTLDNDAWASALIRSGCVRIDVDNSEKYTPHMLSLDLSGAVSFDKGCYTGQEVVARTEHRGRSRRRLARYECVSPSNATGDELFADNLVVGTVVNASGQDVLAVIPVDFHKKTLSLNGKPANPAPL